ncbi:glycosyltransferase family 4 protein [Acidobacteria bacterium AB60]|nr:glycosyltransferase family 4 protein [Acidobacteria bacterium AB60]
MQLCLTLDHRFLQTPDGGVWTVTQCPYSFYEEYLEVFDSVRVIARAFPVTEAEPHFLPVEGPGVEFFPVASYKGPVQYLRRVRSVRRSIQSAVPQGSAVILRVPSQVANTVEASLRARNHPYAVDIVADPYDVLSPAANPSPLAGVARVYFTRLMKDQALRAIAIRYVTLNYLQQRYPARGDANVMPPLDSPVTFNDSSRAGHQYVTAVSDANLPDDWFVEEPRRSLREKESIHALFIGTLGSLYKGPDTLIRAVALAKSEGAHVLLRFAGSGKHVAELKSLAGSLGVGEQITFLGDVQAGAGIRAELDRSDVFVLPSRAEGVPRAMLEAMARGLPCLGSHAGGIPELLHEEDRVQCNDASALAAKFVQISGDGGRVARMSIRNLQTARKYATSRLRERRRGFLEAVRELTADHHRSGAATARPANLSA